MSEEIFDIREEEKTLDIRGNTDANQMP